MIHKFAKYPMLFVVCSSLPLFAQFRAVHPASAPVKPTIESNAVNSEIVETVHLRPLFTTAIRLPEVVTSIAVGAPTMFDAEHSKSEPQLVFVKPSTHEPAESNLLIALKSGRTVSVTLISSGDAGSADPVDYVVAYKDPRPMLTPGDGAEALHSAVPGDSHAVASAVFAQQPPPTGGSDMSPVDSALAQQVDVAAPAYITGSSLKKKVYADKLTPTTFSLAPGFVYESGSNVSISYSVMNTSDHWIEFLPPQVQLADPHAKPTKKHPASISDQVPVIAYKATAIKLAPRQRADFSLVFTRPYFKRTHDTLLLQVALSTDVDVPFLLPIKFVAPSN